LLSGTYLHYAPDAFYTTINPAVVLKIRSLILEIIKQAILFKQVFVNKKKVHLWINNGEEKYSVFNAKYYNSRTEVTNHTSFTTDLQFANNFGKLAGEFITVIRKQPTIKLKVLCGNFCTIKPILTIIVLR
jgi:hypothetical protein